jgi:hypothetical protein
MPVHPLLERFLTQIQVAAKRPVLQAFDAAGETLVPGQHAMALDARLAAAGQELADTVEEDTANPYHNRTHAAEAVWAAATLWEAENQARVAAGKTPWPARDGLVLLVAMVAHDLHHTGQVETLAPGQAPSGREEAASARAALKVLRWHEVDEATQARIAHIIRHTEPLAGVPAARAAYAAAPSLETLLPVLAAEADLLASVLPWTGPRRGEQLGREWTAAGAEKLAQAVTRWPGRERFLGIVTWTSAGAHALGLPAWVTLERQVLAQHAADWDSLPFEVAESAHHQAIEAALAVEPPRPEARVASAHLRRPL